MTHFRALMLASFCTACLCWQTAHAQTATRLLEQGVRSYQGLEFDAAVAFLQRALAPTVTGQQMADPDVARALIYLAASEVFRGNPDSARAAFGRLIRLDARYHPDRLVFPPEVTNVYDAVRRETKIITVDIPPTTRLRLGQDRLSIGLFASSYHDISAEIRDRDSIRVRQVYRGPIVDSLEIEWDGLSSERVVVPSGPYSLWISSRDSLRRVIRTVQIPLDVMVQTADTLPHPLAPADSLILPEQYSGGPGIRALVGGLLIGTAVAVLPAAVSSDTDLMGARYVVAGTISIAGVTTFFRRRPGKPIPVNIEANRSLVGSWQNSLAVVVSENERRKADVHVVITAGSPVVREGLGR